MGRPTAADTIEVGPVRIREQANGRFRLRWQDAGRERETTSPSLKDAKALALDIAIQLRDPAATLAAESTVGKLILRAIDPADHPSWGKRYIETLHCDVRNHIAPAMGDLTCGELSRRHCADLLNSMAAAGYSKHTIDRVRKALRLVVKEGVKLGIWRQGADPMADVRLPAAVGTVELDAVDHESIPTDAQASALCAALHGIQERYGVLGDLARLTGMRYSEILGLQAGDINLTTREIRVRRQRQHDAEAGWVANPPKTKAGRRTVVIAKELEPVLCGWLDRNSFAADDFIITTVSGTGISASNWADVMKRAKRLSGYPKSMTTHTLRHYCATRWLRLGAPVADVSRMLGHANPAITMKLYVSGDAESVDRMKGLV